MLSLPLGQAGRGRGGGGRESGERTQRALTPPNKASLTNGASIRRLSGQRPAGQGLPFAADFYGELGSAEGNVPRAYKHVQMTDARGHGRLGPTAAVWSVGRSLGLGVNSSLLKCDIPLLLL